MLETFVVMMYGIDKKYRYLSQSMYIHLTSNPRQYSGASVLVGVAYLCRHKSDLTFPPCLGQL